MTTNKSPDQRSSKSLFWAKVLSWAVVIIAIIATTQALPLKELAGDLLVAISVLGWWGYLAYFLLYILASVCFIPGSILTLGAGFLFGVVKGSLLVSVSSTAGAVAAFWVARHVARARIAEWIAKNPRFAAVDGAIAREGWKIVFMVRLSPLFPFIFLNYALGLTRISLRDYALASWLGMLPATLMYVYLGSLAQELSQLGIKNGARTPSEWFFYVAGLLATVAVTLYVTRLAKTALAEKI